MQATCVSRVVCGVAVVCVLGAAGVVPEAGAQKVWQWSQLRRVPPPLFTLAMTRHQGILSRGQMDSAWAKIGMQSVSVEAIRHRPTHRPIDGFKRAHTGTVTYLHKRERGTIDDDDDVNMDISPLRGSTFAEQFIASGKTAATEVEGEIDVATGKWPLIKPGFPRLFALATGYGPWIHEKHDYFDTRVHDYLEIHPMEQLWRADVRRQRLVYSVGIFSDNSGRFDRWRASPMVTTTGIAFEQTRGSPPLRYTLRVQDQFKALASPPPPDQTRTHVLMAGTDTILVVQEPASGPDFFNIELVSAVPPPVSLPGGGLPGGGVPGAGLPRVQVTERGAQGERVRGFIRINAAVTDGGHHLWTVTEESRVITPAAEVEVQLMDIVCESVDDDDDTEDLFGSYGVSAAVGGQPFHANAYGNEVTNTLWAVSRDAAMQLRRGDRRVVGTVLRYRLDASGELTVHGNIDERDTGVGGGGDDDRLGPRQQRVFRVAELLVGRPVRVVDVHASGGSRIRVAYVVTRRR